jgi:hypothetical protein
MSQDQGTVARLEDNRSTKVIQTEKAGARVSGYGEKAGEWDK